MRRGYNIDSLAVGTTEDTTMSRMTIVGQGDDHILEQVEKQLNKVIPVIKVRSLGPDAVTAELLLVKVACDPATLGKVNEIAALMKAEVADVSKSTVTLKYAGEHERCETLLDLLRPYGIREISRTGVIAWSGADWRKRKDRRPGWDSGPLCFLPVWGSWPSQAGALAPLSVRRSSGDDNVLHGDLALDHLDLCGPVMKGHCAVAGGGAQEQGELLGVLGAQVQGLLHGVIAHAAVGLQVGIGGQRPGVPVAALVLVVGFRFSPSYRPRQADRMSSASFMQPNIIR